MKLPFSVNSVKRLLGFWICVIFLSCYTSITAFALPSVVGPSTAITSSQTIPIVSEYRISDTAGQIPLVVTIEIASYTSTSGMQVQDDYGNILSGATSSVLNRDGTKRFSLETRVEKPYTGEWYVYLKNKSNEWVKTDTQFTVDFTAQTATPSHTPAPSVLYVLPGTRFKAEASSVYRQKYNNTDYKVTADMVVDGKLNTAWNEGGSGNGVGEWVRLTPVDGKRYTYNGFRIANGFQYHNYEKGDRWVKNNRVSSLHVYADGRQLIGTFAIDDLKDGYQTVYFETPVECSFLQFEIADVWKGNDFPDTCISELEVF